MVATRGERAGARMGAGERAGQETGGKPRGSVVERSGKQNGGPKPTYAQQCGKGEIDSGSRKMWITSVAARATYITYSACHLSTFSTLLGLRQIAPTSSKASHT